MDWKTRVLGSGYTVGGTALLHGRYKLFTTKTVAVDKVLKQCFEVDKTEVND